MGLMPVTGGGQSFDGASMRAAVGAMRHRVTLRSVARSKDAGAYATDTATTEATVWADVQVEAGLEQVQQAGLLAQSLVRFRVRYREDIDGTWRIVWRGATYELVEPPLNLDARRRFLWLRGRQVEGM